MADRLKAGESAQDRPRFSTERAKAVLAQFAKNHGGDDPAELATDLLADLMHFCDDRGLDFDELLETAKGNYEAEVREAGA